jgi:phytanoyl-CoA hydroxylase
MAAAGLTKQERASWEERGFLVLRSFFSDEEIEPVNEQIARLWENRAGVEDPITVDYLLNTTRAGHGLLRDAPEDARDAPYKLNNLYQWSPEVRALSCNARLAAVLTDLLDGPPLAFNTLNFERGSQQGDHFDTYFMPAPVTNKMLATWIALEDIEPVTGPLRYYPGSHLVAPYRFSHGFIWSADAEMPAAESYNDDAIRSRFATETFVPRKGDVLIWHSQLLHAGEPIEDLSLTRRSLVTHYFRATDFEVPGRSGVDPDELFARYLAMRPNWRPFFLDPAVGRTADGQRYLDKTVDLAPADDATAYARLAAASGVDDASDRRHVAERLRRLARAPRAVGRRLRG